MGLSISDTTVHAVEVNGRAQSSVVTASAVAAVPPGVVEQGSVRDTAGFTEVLERLWSESPIRSRDVVVGLGPHEAFVRAVELPRLRRRDRRSALGFELADMLPFPTSEAVIDYRQIDTEDDAEFDRFLVVAAHAPTLDPVIEAVDRSRLRMRALDVPAFAAVRAVRALGPEPEESSGDVAAVVAIGAELLTVTVHERGAVRFTRQVPVAQGAGAELSGVLENELSTIHAHAGTSSGPTRATGRNPVVDAVYTTIEFEGQTPGAAPVGSIDVLGGGPVATALYEGLSGESAVPVHHISAWPSTDERPPLDADWVAMGHAIEVPTSLAPAWPRVLPDQAVGQRRTTTRIAVASGFAGVAASLGLLALAGPPVNDRAGVVAGLEAEVAQVENELSALDTEVSESVELEQGLAAAATIRDSGTHWGEILAALRAGQPPGSTLQAFEAVGPDLLSGEPATLHVSVESADPRAVEDWLNLFEGIPELGDPVLEQVASVPSESGDGGATPDVFSIRATVGATAEELLAESEDEFVDDEPVDEEPVAEEEEA